MAVSYLTKTELGEFFHSNGNIEAGVRSALIDSLEQSGVFNDDDNSARGWLQSGPFPGGEVPPVVQILGVSNSTNVETNPNLKAIVLDDHSARLDVTGGDNDVFVAAGKGHDTINLNDSGNDTVYGGSGNDVIRASEGDNLLFGGAGNDSIYGGAGNDTLDGGAGNDLLVSGGARAAGVGGDARIASADDSAFGAAGRGHHHGGGHGDDRGWGRGDDHGGGRGGDHGGGVGEIEGHSTLIGGAGNDTLVGMQGDVLQGGAGNDQFTLLSGDGSANSTLYGGGGDDTFRIEARSGSDTIFGGNGNDTAEFVGRSFFDVAKIDVDASTSTYTLHFSDQQTVAVNGVEELHFSDQIVTLPKLS
ncbi:hemolysin-type calcium-binding region [Nitrobacter winogradskyi Nb-255]|uniref:Hemolysin-type calcium-binding region n=1 Tax=Nitrobacter winogradskyi (strain ATCC 25391 / DSM 10237 / CIP 104748 / NCIMB 11846 / Nb-255) TaxID=323098 RepID=Q3SV91_NITWN|nr:calcium-binding protein [Nitrobacter winogradskyi]ABA03800.1 hemolysin-type calcium-binding region [Nitrobacter winogradskyi Nb-255]